MSAPEIVGYFDTLSKRFIYLDETRTIEKIRPYLKPVLKPGDTMQIKDNRYHITTP